MADMQRALQDLDSCISSCTRIAGSHLRDAVGRGFPHADLIEQDSDLSTLRGDPEFQKLVTAARENRRRWRAREAEGT